MPPTTAHILSHALFFGVVGTGYLLLIMRAFSPRIWGYSDYPRAVRDQVPPQTTTEKRKALALFLPWLLFIFAFPIYSTLLLKARLGGAISLGPAFVSLVAMLATLTFGDLVLLDWLLIAKVTPRWVIIDGTDAADYKDLGYHYRGQLLVTLALIPVLLLIAYLITL